MLSGFELCGLSQLIALHYGTLPIVREAVEGRTRNLPSLAKRAMGEVSDWNRSARIYLEVCKKDLK